MGLGKTYSTQYLADSDNNTGAAGQVLISTVDGINWSDGTGIIGGPYLPLAAGSGSPLTGDLYINDDVPSIILNDTNATSPTSTSAYVSFRSQGTQQGFVGYGSGSNNDIYLYGGSGSDAVIYSGAGLALTLDTSQNATFTGDVTVIGKTTIEDSGSVQLDLRRGSLGQNGNTSILFTQPLGNGYIGVDATGAFSYNIGANLTASKFKVDRSGNTTISGDLTVSGGDITLGGATGRIQGIDTINAGTDAVNRNYVDTEIANIPSGLAFEGNWNASTDTPTLAGTTQDNGKFWIVTVAGSTNLSGITDWAVGDWAIYVDNGAGTDAWQKVDNSSTLSGLGAAGKVAFWSTTANVSFNNNFSYDGTYLTSPRIRVGDGTDGFFYSDSAGRTAFTGGNFYIQSGVSTYYNYATTQYHGNTSGDNHLFRGNPLSGNNWSITAAGEFTATLGTFSSATDQILNLVSSDSNAVYIALKRASTRTAYIGHGSGGSTLSFVNEIAGGTITLANTSGSVNINNGGSTTISGDLTVSGGDITLSGTGRIQGVDTVSASTDAANKAYVDAHPAGTVTGTGLSAKVAVWTNTTNIIDGPITFSSNDAAFAGDLTVNGGDIILGGTGRIQGIDTVSSGTDAANKTYVDAQGTNFLQNEGSFISGDTLFEILETDTTADVRTKLSNASGSIVRIDDYTAPAGGCFQLNNAYISFVLPQYHKLDDDQEYTFELWGKFISGTDTDQLTYLGSSFYGSTKNYLGNSQRYWGESSFAIDSNTNNDGWYFMSGTLGPARGASTGQIPTAAHWMKLIMLLNYSSQANTVRYCGLKVYKSGHKGAKKVTSIYRKSLGSQASSSADQWIGEVVMDTAGALHAPNITLADGIYHKGDTNTYINFLTDTIQMATAGSPRVYINSAGNVGIGTTSLQAALDVAGDLRIDGYSTTTNEAGLYLYNNIAYSMASLANCNNSYNAFRIRGRNTATNTLGIGSNGNSDYVLQVVNDAGTVSGNISINPYGGNVGIGTTSPGGKLHVEDPTVYMATAPDVFKISQRSPEITFKDLSSYIAIDTKYQNSAGSTLAKHTVQNNPGGAFYKTTFDTGSAGGSVMEQKQNSFHWTVNNSQKLTLNTLGYLGINDTTPSYQLDVNGNGRFTSTVTATNFILSSDERLKENIEKASGNRVKIDWKTFELKTEKGQKRYGVIAQELEKTNPEFVRKDTQGFKSVAYIDLLIAKIAELESRLEKLEK